MHEEILIFIHKRFPINCSWLEGNCYYFAVILKERFQCGQIYYDIIDGHFVWGCNGKYYDWTGEIKPKGKLIPWRIFKQYDKIQYEVIMRDCVR